MSGHTKWSEIKHKATPAQLAKARKAFEREQTLSEVRRAREMTQKQLARSLETSQPRVAQIERQTDLYVSTLRSYVEALGGQLEVLAVFPDGVVPIRAFEELERQPEPA